MHESGFRAREDAGRGAAAHARYRQQSRSPSKALRADRNGERLQPSPYLELLSDVRDEFTVFSGLSHPGVDGAHSTDNCFLRRPGRVQIRLSKHHLTGSIRSRTTSSVDAVPNLNLASLTREAARRSLSFTRDGVCFPETSPANVFGKMFVQGDAAAVTQLDLLAGAAVF